MRSRPLVASAAAVLTLLGAGVAMTQQAGPARKPPHVAPVNPAARRAYFGELHLHTVMSFDAWTFGTRVTPDQAYRFARGETVMVPAFQVAREQGLPVSGLVPA